MTNTMNTHPDFTAILKDGLVVENVHTGGELAWFHKNTNQSMDWELANGGYSIVTGRTAVNGWLEFHMAATRRGYGMNGFIARTAREVVALIESRERGDVGHGEYRDFVVGPEIAKMLEAIVGLLSSTDGGSAFDSIRGDIDTWAHSTAARIGESIDD